LHKNELKNKLNFSERKSRTGLLQTCRTCPYVQCTLFLWKRAAGSNPHYGQSLFAFIKAVQNFQYWNVRDRL